MKIILKLISLVILTSSTAFSQFDKPIIQFGLGISEPFNDLKGTYYNYGFYKGIQTLNIDTNFIANNYGAKTGFNFFGAAKFNFDKYSISRGVISLNFNTFNTFEPNKNGNGIFTFISGNDTITTATPISYSYTFRNFSLGLGLEVAPLSFTNVVSPFFAANFNFNFLGATLSRMEGFDTTTIDFSDFRLGVSFNTGIEFKFSKYFGMTLGIKYDIANLMLKNTYSSVSDRIEWGRNNAPLNDAEGTFISSLPGFLSGSLPVQYTAKEKKINWGTIYIGFNLYLDTKSKPKKKDK